MKKQYNKKGDLFMKKIFFVSLISIFGVLSLCSCNATSENAPESAGNSITSVSSEVETTTVSDTSDSTAKKTLHTVSNDELPEYSVLLSDIYKDLPDFSTSYLDAKLPESITDNLYIYSECNLYLADDKMIKFRRSNTDLSMFEQVFNYISWGCNIIEPKLFYDTGNFYIIGKSEISGTLVKICLDDFIIQDLGTNADTISVDDVKEVLQYNIQRLCTFVQKNDGTYSFYRLGKEISNLRIDAEPEDIVFNKPFIGNGNTLYYISVPFNPNFRIQMYTEKNVKELYDCSYSSDKMESSCYLYEKNTGKLCLIGYDSVLIEFKTFEFESNVLSNLNFKVDKYNRCYIYSGEITLEKDSEDYTFYPNIGIFVRKISEKELENEKVKEFLSRKFSYAEKDDIIEELLS